MPEPFHFSTYIVFCDGRETGRADSMDGINMILNLNKRRNRTPGNHAVYTVETQKWDVPEVYPIYELPLA